MAEQKILVVEDDKTMLEVLKYNLKKDGYDVVTATNGIQALDVARNAKPDLIILDIMLPELSGLDVCRTLRKELTVPILMLTAKGEEIDKVVGLEIGADDYVTKPFSMKELLARIRAIMRRTEMFQQDAVPSGEEPALRIINTGDIKIDVARHSVTLRGVSLDLSPKEFDLLTFLVSNSGRVFEREHLLNRIWGYDYIGDTRTVDVHVRWLRRKIEIDPSRPKHIVTVRGVGYKFEA
jgi:two-component system OmpR family response regulator